MAQDIKALKEYIEGVIEKYMPHEAEEHFAQPVIEAMNYSVSAGGKRLRPMLMYLTYKALSEENSEIVEPFMAAIEMIHTYSLIHDDLPALDNDDYRRGRLTCHKVYGEDMAILAGDALLNFAYETAAKAFSIKPGSVDVEKAYVVLTRKPGIYGMVGGQVRDVYLTGKEMSEEAMMYIYENKTAALIQCAMIIGAHLAGADDVTVNKISDVAYKIGMAFQVQDDILDIVGDEKVLGKPVGSDEKNDKHTYATVYGIDRAREYVAKATDEAVSIINEINTFDKVAEKELTELLLSLVNREM